MRQRSRRPYPLFLVALLGTVAALPSRAQAVCSLSACDATALIANAACCSASACTIDGTLTVSGPTCSFDFGTRNLTVSGQVAAQGKTITLTAKSMKLTGLIDVRGPSGANAGNVTIVTTGMTAVAYSQEGGTSAVIDASSSAGNGGHITIQADGMVSFAKGLVNANGGSAASGGIVSVTSTAGDISVMIPVTASSGASAAVPNGQILVTGQGNLAIGGSGRLISDQGDIDIDVAGAASFADGSVIQADVGGGSITLVAASLSSLGEFSADGFDGSIDLRTTSGPMFLQRLSQGITVGPGVQSVALTTDATGANGLLTMDMPITANGAEVEIDSGGDLMISKKIETTGLLDSEAGDITIDADGDITISKAIVGADVYGEADLSIEGRDVTITGNFDFRGGLDTSGGHVDVTADRDLLVTGDIFLNVSGADSSDGGSIDLQAAHNLTIGNSVELIADASPVGSAGSILLIAGEGFAEHLPGSVTMQGDIKANGHNTGLAAAFVVIQGCDVNVANTANIDVTGDAQSNTRIIARSSVTMAGQLKSTLANTIEFRTGSTLTLTGTFAPARSAGACVDGTVTADGCSRAECTAANTPAGCLSACPQCGDGVEQFPETCEIGVGGAAFCSGQTLCDSRCRERVCAAPNSCTLPSCDAAADACGFTTKVNGVDCDDDQNICTGVGTCLNGSCRLTQGSVLQCNDHNPCTGPDTCDPQSGCQNPSRADGPGVPGCDDGQFCNGTEKCVSGECTSGALPCTAPQVCNPATEQCEGPAACTLNSQCDDGNPCTDNVCSGGFCTNPPASVGTDCDDGDLCDGVRTCDGTGICSQVPTTPPVDCDDNDLCTVDSCNPASGLCTNAPLDGCCTTAAQCNDGDACTTDSCTADHTCEHVAITCSNPNPCKANACDSSIGCTLTDIPGCQACADASTCPDDADPCTDKACVTGRCAEVGNPFCCQQDADCTDIDSNPCTNNGTCVANRCGPTTPRDGASCGNTCNPATCHGTTCTLDPPPDCSDSDACTSDVCVEGQGCVHTPIALCCFDASVCADTNVCTDDTCDLDANRCTHIKTDPTCTPCDGSNPFECGPRCLNTCQGGRCTEIPPNCADTLSCTTDSCDPDTGCVHTANCDDHDPCTTDACDGGGCSHTATPNAPGCEPCTVTSCDDGDLCTTDTCGGTDGTTCVHDPKTSFDSILCRLDGMTAALAAASPDDVNAKLKKQLGSIITKARAKVVKASATGLKCKKARSLLGTIRAPLRKLQKTVNKQAGRKIQADLATTLATLAGQAATTTDSVRGGLGC